MVKGKLGDLIKEKTMEATSKAEARKHNIAYIVRICCIAALGGILLGYDTAVISGAIGQQLGLFNGRATP